MSSDISQFLVANLGKGDRLLGALSDMAARGRTLFEEKGDLDEIGAMLHEAFQIKAAVNPRSVTPEISQLYEYGLERGALGGKVLGAGGGGFVMFWLTADDRPRFIEAMESCVVVPARPEHEGAVILFAEASTETSGGTA